MRKNFVLKSLILVAASGLLMTSCLEDPEPIPLDAIPDVFVQKVLEDTVVKYGLSFWVLGNKDLESVEIEGPDDGSWTLEAEGDVDRVFILYPEAGDYIDEMPATGDYAFTLTSKQAGELPLTLKDKLETKEIDVAVVDSIGFGNLKQYVSWGKVTGAENYYIRLYSDSGKRLFQSLKLGKDADDYAFGVDDDGWLDENEVAEEGETYQLEVIALLYETNTNASNEDFNVQMISISSNQLVWGE